MTDTTKATIDGIERTVASSEAWREALEALRQKEKELTRAHDALAAERRRSPWMRIRSDHRFEGESGPRTLVDLFAGRRQLVVYHHMLRPADPSPCSGCGMVGDQIPHLSHLEQRDTTLVFVSRAPIAEISAFKRRMGWQVDWYSTLDGFNADVDVTDAFGLNVFYRDGDDVYRTYFTTGRGVETLGTIWTFLDLTPLGRQEDWESSPEGTPQTAPYGWWRLHDEYGTDRSRGRDEPLAR